MKRLSDMIELETAADVRFVERIEKGGGFLALVVIFNTRFVACKHV